MVVKLAAGSTTQTVLPLTDLMYPFDIAVDNAGTVYITDARDYPGGASKGQAINSRVLKLAPDSTQTDLPFTGLNDSQFLAVRPPWMAGPTDSVYLSDILNNRVLRLGLG